MVRDLNYLLAETVPDGTANGARTLSAAALGDALLRRGGFGSVVFRTRLTLFGKALEQRYEILRNNRGIAYKLDPECGAMAATFEENSET